ncbi:hypothetical protein [Phaeodactylibacter sp.]|uniref:T9SS type A sorting domain-containing protein n=1 Tax=Phaeodactylibacter sp. TaxID=1940289 RepID=UPI0025E99FF5|nr:hypothetical protein [Phaeodactylibacter sp.]MCI4650471.1 hypothetical protein [Phaeodactylibacter sp.]MCI5093527.1 hypothetical protein [Phaeodactylibacter sp.]
MRTFLALLCCMVGFTSNLSAQKHDYTWLFSEQYIISNDWGEASMLDFNSSPPAISAPDSVQMIFGGTNFTMSNAEGELIFYTNGCEIHNARHQLMENGDGINPGDVHDVHCHESQHSPGYIVPTQGALALLKPGSNYVYYLFHIRSAYDPVLGPPYGSHINLLYTIVDMTQSSGNGIVYDKNTVLVDNSSSFTPLGEITAVKHANGQDWWIICPENQGNYYHKFLLTSEGIVEQSGQNIGTSIFRFTQGQSVFSPDGSKFAYILNDENEGIRLFDFDRETGLFSNPHFFPIPDDPGIQAGAAFSPSGRYLYASYNFELYQFDLWAPDIEASRVLIDTFDGYADPIPTHFANMQLGPDCRIYVFCSSCTTIHIIHNPDEGGTDCNFEQNAIQLPFGMRQFSNSIYPNYRLGPIDNPGEPCDSGIVNSSNTILPAKGISLFPNPSSGEAIHLQTGWTEANTAEAILFNALGQPVWQRTLELFGGNATFQLDHLPEGWYQLSLRAEGEQNVIPLMIQR